MFAFGANMHVPSVKRIAPGAAPLGPGRADGFRFRIQRHGFATLAPDAAGAVHGLVWKVGPVEEAVLDDYEDVDLGLYVRRWIRVVHEGRERRALVYLTATLAPGRPRPGYMDKRVLPAARALGLPAHYVTELEAWAAKAGYVPSPFEFY